MMIDYIPLFPKYLPIIYLVPETVLNAVKQNNPVPDLVYLIFWRESRHWKTKIHTYLTTIGIDGMKKNRVLRKNC